MPDLSYGTSAFERDRGNFPELPVINMFAEEVSTEGKLVLQSRPGLESTSITMGAGPIRALFQTDGVLNNQLYGVSDTGLYSSSTLLGAVSGTGPATIAGYEDFLFVNAGSNIHGYDGTSLSTVAFPDSASIVDICVGASRLIAIRKDTGKFYWSDALTSTIDALSFATAENSPDKLRACLFIGDTLILFGAETVEFWPVSEDANSPFQPLVGRVFQVGIRATGCATNFSSTFAWITDRNQICVGEPNEVISFPGLEAKINESISASLWSFTLEGVEFLALTLDNETWVFSSRSKQWSTFESYGETNFILTCSTGDYLGSNSGAILQWSNTHTDLGGLIERRFRAGAVINSQSQPVHNLLLRTNQGQTPYIVGTYSNPTVEMRTSRDGGYNWNDWKVRSLGEQGEYRKEVKWLGLGHFAYPGVLVEFRVTDPVPFRVSGVLVNEPYGAI